jgi:hypothetical protein
MNLLRVLHRAQDNPAILLVKDIACRTFQRIRPGEVRDGKDFSLSLRSYRKRYSKYKSSRSSCYPEQLPVIVQPLSPSATDEMRDGKSVLVRFPCRSPSQGGFISELAPLAIRLCSYTLGVRRRRTGNAAD